MAAEHALLSGNGHSVFQYTVHNESVSAIPTIQLGANTVWNGASYRIIRRLVAELGIQIVHVHNTTPLISPAVYYAAEAERVPVIQTLHNYRTLCPAATLYRNGAICELCLHKRIKYPAVMHGCYRGSYAASAALAATLAVHHFAGTYRRKIQTYIALTEFAKSKFREGGLPAERLTVKPNFLAEDPGAGSGQGGYALFAGRLTPEKGLAVLLDAWSANPHAIPLKIAGAGPMQTYVRERAGALANVEYLGPLDHSVLIELLKAAAFLVFPSRWYEGMPIVLLESMACGTPVLAFALGSLNDLIVDGVNGVKLPAGDADALTRFLRDANGFAGTMALLRSGTRAYFERHFSAAQNYPLLLDIYNRALNEGVR